MLSFIEVLAVIVPLLVTCFSYPEASHPIGGGDLFLRFLIRLLLVVYIILIHSLQLLGYFNHYIIKYSIVPESWLDSIRAYRVNKHLGILTPRHERRYFRILAEIETYLTFEHQVTFIDFPNYRSIIIENLQDLNDFIAYFIAYYINYFITSTNLLGPSTLTPSTNSSSPTGISLSP